MVNIVQAILSVLTLRLPSPQPGWPPVQSQSQTNKSIAIVGAGSAGLAALKAILDLPLNTRQFWSIVVFEQRRDVGGIWLPDPVPPHPPVLPSTPLYPRLHTNTPHPTMTYPGYPFPPMTPLFPQHEYVLAYHRDYAEHFGLTHYIRFNTTVEVAAWSGDESRGFWNVKTRRTEGNLQDNWDLKSHQFDHILVASDHNQYPAVPDFPGSETWLKNSPSRGPQRSIVHSVFYRDADDFANQTVVVVGGGASGLDVTSQVNHVGRKTYLSLKADPNPLSNTTGINLKPRLTHFTRDGPIFIDNASAVDADTIVLATGYEVRVPFFEAGGALRTDRYARSNNSIGYTGLTTNLRYLFPLHDMVFSLSSYFSPTALSFVGLPVLIANCPSDRAQALFVAHVIANGSLLAPRDVLIAQLAQREKGEVLLSSTCLWVVGGYFPSELESRGFDPYYVGHRLVGGPGVSEDYQDRIVQYLKDNGAIPQDGKNFSEQWRRDARKNGAFLKRAWARIKSQGKSEENKWLRGVITEDNWAHLLNRLAMWQEEYEKGP